MGKVIQEIQKGHLIRILSILEKKLPETFQTEVQALLTRVEQLKAQLDEGNFTEREAQKAYDQLAHQVIQFSLQPYEKVSSTQTELHIYWSYAWGTILDEANGNEGLILQAIEKLREAQYQVIDNKWNLPILGLEHEFIDEIRQAQAVLVCLDQAALKNPQFMYELLTIGRSFRWKDSAFEKFIIPIKLESLPLSDMEFLDQINIFWENEDEYWAGKILEEELQYISEAQTTRYEQTSKILSELENLLFWIERMDRAALKLEKEADVKQLMDILEERFGKQVK